MTTAGDSIKSGNSNIGRHLGVGGEQMLDRIFATMLGLHRVCIFRLCRRHKRCLGPGIKCFEHHNGLARKRYRTGRWWTE